MALKELPPYCVLVENQSIIPAESSQMPGTKPVSNLLDRSGRLVQPVFVPGPVKISPFEENGVHIIVQTRPPEIEPVRRN